MNILFYDGDCILCNRFINFLITNNKNSNLYFISQRCDNGKKLMKKYKINISEEYSTIYLVLDGIIYNKSNAILKSISKINWLFKIVCIPFYLIPKTLRDFFYLIISKYRRKIITKNICYNYKPEIKKYLID